jgi:hypothetical protein
MSKRGNGLGSICIKRRLEASRPILTRHDGLSSHKSLSVISSTKARIRRDGVATRGNLHRNGPPV